MQKIALERHNVLIAVLAGYFLLNCILRVSLSGSLGLDEAEQVLLSQWLLPGYNTQPPFYNWLQYATFSVFGLSLTVLAALKNVVLFTTYLLYWLTARLLLKNRDLAAIATLGLLTIPQIAFEAQRDLTHTVASLFAVSLFLYGFFRTLLHPGLFSYAVIGLATGIGLISKYNFAIIPLVALIAVLPEADLRRRIYDWRILVAAAIAIAIITPHALWLAGNLDHASQGTLNKMVAEGAQGRIAQIFKGLLSLAIATAAFGALTVVVFLAVFRSQFIAALRASNRWTRILERIMIASLIVVVLIIVGSGATNIKERWLTPFLLVLPLYLCLKLDAAGANPVQGLRRFFSIALVLMALVVTALYGRVILSQWTGSYTKLNIPFASFAEKIIEETGKRPALIIADDQHLAGNVRMRIPGIPVITPFFPDQTVAPERLAGGPVLFIWKGNGEATPPMPARLRTVLHGAGLTEDAVTPHHVTLPYYYNRGNDGFGFGYGWLNADQPDQ